MNVVARLRRLRHGRLAHWSLAWKILGALHRAAVRALPFRAPVTMRIGPYGPFRLDSRFTFSNFENWGSGRNAAFQTCVELSAGARCVLDVGAHIGLVSLPVSSVLAGDGKVFAFEPARVNARILCRHVAINHANNIEIIENLIGEYDANDVAFYEQLIDSGLNSTAPGDGTKKFVKTHRRQISLDSFCGANGARPDLIKIDTEGAEIGILRGARQTLMKYRPTIILSVHPEQIDRLGENLDDLAAMIVEMEYEFRDATGLECEPREPTEYILRPRPSARREPQ